VTGRPLLECRHLRKRFGELVAVDGISFEIAAGETYGLLGPNGAGKTTGLAALGGSTVPLEVFPDRVRAVAHLTPHARANDSFAELLRHGGGIADVLSELGALFAFAAAVLALATWRLRSAILSAS
jgi:ABC-2 type transport system permease protein